MKIWRKCVSLLTSAALLLAMLMTPGVHHVHAEGDRPHSHAAAAGHHHEDAAHHHGHSHQHSATAAPIAHTHLSLLFFDFTLPQRDDDESDSEWPQLLPVAGCSVSWQSAAPGGSPWAVDAANDARPRELPHVSAPGGGTRPQARNLLCDSARGARSGVLLI